MTLNTIVFEGNLATTPKLDRTTNGAAVTAAIVLANRRIKDTADQRVDAEPTPHRIKSWRTLAEHLANLPPGPPSWSSGPSPLTPGPTRPPRKSAPETPSSSRPSVRQPGMRTSTSRAPSTSSAGSDDDQAGA